MQTQICHIIFQISKICYIVHIPRLCWINYQKPSNQHNYFSIDSLTLNVFLPRSFIVSVLFKLFPFLPECAGIAKINVLILICELAFVHHTLCLEINLKYFIVKRARRQFNLPLNHRLYILEEIM